MLQRFQRRTALVSAAGRGIGAASARRIYGEGGSVVVTDHDFESARSVVQSLGGESDRLRAVKLDVTEPEDWGRAVEVALGTTGRLDILHHNAGRNDFLRMHEITDEHWHAQIALNLDSAMYGVRACIEALRETGDGAIVFTSSIQAKQGFPGFPAYAASKAGLIGLAQQLAVDYSPEVRINVVLPGVVETDSWATMEPEERERWRLTSPLGKFTQGEDVAAAVAFLASSDARVITGQSLVVDGGSSILGRWGS